MAAVFHQQYLAYTYFQQIIFIINLKIMTKYAVFYGIAFYFSFFIHYSIKYSLMYLPQDLHIHLLVGV